MGSTSAWVQFESPHSIDEIKAARAAITGPFSFMKGKLGRYLDLDEHLALGVTIAWYPGFTHHVTWAALWDFMFARDSPLEVPVTSELVSETTVSGLLECGWELSGR